VLAELAKRTTCAKIPDLVEALTDHFDAGHLGWRRRCSIASTVSRPPWPVRRGRPHS